MITRADIAHILSHYPGWKGVMLIDHQAMGHGTVEMIGTGNVTDPRRPFHHNDNYRNGHFGE